MGFWNFSNAAERRAKKWLQHQGLQLVCQNYRCLQGELDLVFVDAESGQKTIIIVEVKFRQKAFFGLAEDQVTVSKQKKIKLATQHFLLAFPCYQNHFVRFDVLAINGDAVRWIQQAFQ